MRLLWLRPRSGYCPFLFILLVKPVPGLTDVEGWGSTVSFYRKVLQNHMVKGLGIGYNPQLIYKEHCIIFF